MKGRSLKHVFVCLFAAIVGICLAAILLRFSDMSVLAAIGTAFAVAIVMVPLLSIDSFFARRETSAFFASGAASLYAGAASPYSGQSQIGGTRRFGTTGTGAGAGPDLSSGGGFCSSGGDGGGGIC